MTDIDPTPMLRAQVARRKEWERRNAIRLAGDPAAKARLDEQWKPYKDYKREQLHGQREDADIDPEAWGRPRR